LADSKEEATQHLETLMFLLEALGFMINPEKSHLLPCQDIEFLGLQVDSQNAQFHLPGEKIKQIRKEASELIQKEWVSARHLSETECCLPSYSGSPLFIEPCKGTCRRG